MALEAGTQMLLEALGFEVDRDTQHVASQVDLIADYSSPLETLRYFVECKSGKRKVGVEAVRQLAAIIGSASRPGLPIQGMVLSESGFTGQAKEFGIATGESNS